MFLLYSNNYSPFSPIFDFYGLYQLFFPHFHSSAHQCVSPLLGYLAVYFPLFGFLSSPSHTLPSLTLLTLCNSLHFSHLPPLARIFLHLQFPLISTLFCPPFHLLSSALQFSSSTLLFHPTHVSSLPRISPFLVSLTPHFSLPPSHPLLSFTLPLSPTPSSEALHLLTHSPLPCSLPNPTFNPSSPISFCPHSRFHLNSHTLPGLPAPFLSFLGISSFLFFFFITLQSYFFPFTHHIHFFHSSQTS